MSKFAMVKSSTMCSVKKALWPIATVFIITWEEDQLVVKGIQNQGAY